MSRFLRSLAFVFRKKKKKKKKREKISRSEGLIRFERFSKRWIFFLSFER